MLQSSVIDTMAQSSAIVSTYHTMAELWVNTSMAELWSMMIHKKINTNRDSTWQTCGRTGLARRAASNNPQSWSRCKLDTLSLFCNSFFFDSLSILCLFIVSLRKSPIIDTDGVITMLEVDRGSKLYEALRLARVMLVDVDNRLCSHIICWMNP